MLYTSFNQDSTCFVCGREDGFIVYNCDPPSERFSCLYKDDQPSGIGIIEMLYRTNIFALVGGGKNPQYPRNMLMIWDDHQKKCIAELEFKTPVTGVQLSRSSILVTIIDKAYLYNFSNLDLLSTFDTFNNPEGLAVMTTGDTTTVAVPGNSVGSVIIEREGSQRVISAHTNTLSALALSSDGSQLATASSRGTLIRVWDTTSGEQLFEFRRGLEVVNITSIAFDLDTTRIVVCSDKGTTHIFSLLHQEGLNRRSSLSYIGDYLPSYFSSEWSSITFEVPPGSKCSFSHTSVDTVYAITPENKFLKYIYDIHETTAACMETFEI